MRGWFGKAPSSSSTISTCASRDLWDHDACSKLACLLPEIWKRYLQNKKQGNPSVPNVLIKHDSDGIHRKALWSKFHSITCHGDTDGGVDVQFYKFFSFGCRKGRVVTFDKNRQFTQVIVLEDRSENNCKWRIISWQPALIVNVVQGIRRQMIVKLSPALKKTRGRPRI